MVVRELSSNGNIMRLVLPAVFRPAPAETFALLVLRFAPRRKSMKDTRRP